MGLYEVYKYIKKPEKFIWDLCQYDNHKYARFVSDKLFVKVMYKRFMGEKLNLKNPEKFNEKLQWLKLYYHNPDYCKFVDKAKVKDYISEKIGSEYVIPTIGVYDSPNDIPFEELPEKFVIKCTHDSGSIVLCRNKSELDFEKVKNDLKERLEFSFFWYGREWFYKYVKPGIIIEKAIFDKNGNVPIDYKFFCFNGEMKFVQVDFGRFVDRKSNYYDRNLNLQSFCKDKCPSDSLADFERPENFEKMIEIAQTLSSGIPFLRVDLYNVDGNIYFGEMTFFPGSGCLRLVSDEFDAEKYVGDMIILPEKRK